MVWLYSFLSEDQINVFVCFRYHQVRSYDRNIAVNVWWNPLIEFNTSDCDSKDAKVEGFPTFDKYKFAVLDSENGDEDNEVGPSPSVDIK